MSENLAITPKQRRAIDALAGGDSLAAAAEKAGVSLRTLYRWRTTPGFSAGLRSADAEHLAETARALNVASTQALAVLVGILDDTKVAAGIRLRAADLVLQHRAKFYELLTVSEGLSEAENRLKEEAEA